MEQKATLLIHQMKSCHDSETKENVEKYERKKSIVKIVTKFFFFTALFHALYGLKKSQRENS